MIKLPCFTKEQRALHAMAFKAYEGGVILDSMGAWRSGVPRPTSAALNNLRNTWVTLFLTQLHCWDVTCVSVKHSTLLGQWLMANMHETLISSEMSLLMHLGSHPLQVLCMRSPH